MDVAYLNLRTSSIVRVPLNHDERADIRKLFGEELEGWQADYERPSVSAGVHFGREWFVVDTAFGRRYLALADLKGGFILLAMRPDGENVLVEFDRPVPTDHPSRHADKNFNPVAHRNREQYLAFLLIANNLVFQAEQS